MLWNNTFSRDDDFQKFNGRGEELEFMKSKYRQMEMRLETYEKLHAEMDDGARLVKFKLPIETY